MTAEYGYRAHVDLPLVIGDRCVGAVAAALHQPRLFDEAEFTYRVAHRGDGAIDVEMRDFGRWRPEPPDNHCRNQHRGRGLVILREIATDVVVNPGPEGTHVQFRLPAPAPTSVAGSA